MSLLSLFPLLVQSFALDGLVNIVGGCCGTTPAHIRYLMSYDFRYTGELIKCCFCRALPWPVSESPEKVDHMNNNSSESQVQYME